MLGEKQERDKKYKQQADKEKREGREIREEK